MVQSVYVDIKQWGEESGGDDRDLKAEVRGRVI